MSEFQRDWLPEESAQPGLGFVLDAAESLHQKMHRDHLTGLLNKETLVGLLHERIENGTDDGADFAFLYIDLTNFKRVNDEIGHAAGDSALRGVAGILAQQKLSTTIREDDLMFSLSSGRLGGDEFGVIVELNARSDEWQEKDTQGRLDGLITRLEEEFGEFIDESEHSIEYDGSEETVHTTPLKELGFRVALGGSVWQRGQSAEELMEHAEQQMMKHKATQHNDDSIGRYRS